MAEQSRQQTLLEVTSCKVAFIPAACLFGPLVPLRTIGEQANNCFGRCVSIFRIYRESCLWRIDDLPARINCANHTRTTEAHRFQIDQSKSFAPTRHQEATRLFEQTLFVFLSDASQELDACR